MRRPQAMAEIKGANRVRDALDRRTVGPAGEIPIPVDDMGVGRSRPVSGQRQARDKNADAHLPMHIDVGHLTHDEMTALLLDEVAFVPQPLEVGIKTEQCA